MAKNITEYNRLCLEQGSYMLYNLADYEDGGKMYPTLFNRDTLVNNKELVKTIISQVPFYIHETIDDVPQTDDEIEDFLFLPDSRDSGINNVHSQLRENEFWSPWFRDAWGDEANKLILEIYNNLRWSFISENTYMNAISLLKDDEESTVEFESDEESDDHMKEIVESKLQNIYSLLNYNMNSSEYLNDWAESLVNSGKLTRQEADREILVYKLQDVRNEVIRRKFAGSSILYRMLLNSIDRQGTFCGATRVGRVTGRESYSDPRLMRSVYAPWQIPFNDITSVNYDANLKELWHEKGGIPLGLFEPLFYTDEGQLRRGCGSNEFSVDEPQGSLEVSKVRRSYTLLRLDQVLIPASNNRHGIIYLNPQEFLTREAWDSTSNYATDGGFSYTLRQLLIESYGLDQNISYEDACETILHAIGEGQYNLGSSTEIIYSDATLDAYTTATIGDGNRVANMLDITANKILYHDNSIFKEMGGDYPYPTVNGHPICLMDTTWIEHLKRLGEDKTRVSEEILYGVQVGEVLDLEEKGNQYSFYWVNDDGDLVEERYSTTTDAFVKAITYGDTRTESSSQDSDSPYYGKSYNDKCSVYKEKPVPPIDSFPNDLTLDEREEIRLAIMAENEEKRSALSRIKLLLAENHITPVRAVAMASDVKEKTLTTENGSATLESDFVAPNALVSEVRGKTVVWNQLVEDGYIHASGTSIVGYTPITNNIDCKAGHVYAFDVEGTFNEPISYGCRFRVTGDESFVRTPSIVLLKIQSSASGYVQARMGNPYDIRIAIVDLTTLFGVTEVAQVTDWMKNWVRAYAEAHPEYTAGTLLDSVYERGVSKGANIFDKDGVTDNMYIIASGEIRRLVKDNVWVSDYIPTEGNPYISVKNCGGVAFYDSDYALVGSVGGKSASIFRTYDVPTGAMFFRIDSSTGGQDKNAVMCVYGNYTESSMPPYAPYREPSALDLSFLKGVPNIGIKDTVIDFEKQVVRWDWWTEDLGNIEFTYNSKYKYFAGRVAKGLASIDGGSSVDIKCDSYETFTKGYVGDRLGDKQIAYASSSLISGYGCIYIRDDSMTASDVGADKKIAKLSGKKVVYKMATPIEKTFTELGITIPPSWDGGKPWIRVEAGGTFTVVSSGAEAEATIHYLA